MAQKDCSICKGSGKVWSNTSHSMINCGKCEGSGKVNK